MTSIIVPKLLANVELILQTSVVIDWSVSNAFRNCFMKGFSRSASACKTNMLFGVRNTSRCSFLTSNVTRTLHSGTSNFTECAAVVKRYAMQVEQNDIIWTFFMPITSISLRAQVLLPENDKRKEKCKKLPSLLVILILSNSIFHFINLGVPLKQISEKKKQKKNKHVTLMMK